MIKWIKSFFKKKEVEPDIVVKNHYLAEKESKECVQRYSDILLSITGKYMDVRNMHYVSSSAFNGGMQLQYETNSGVIISIKNIDKVYIRINRLFPHDKIEPFARDIQTLHKKKVEVSVWGI